MNALRQAMAGTGVVLLLGAAVIGVLTFWASGTSMLQAVFLAPSETALGRAERVAANGWLAVRIIVPAGAGLIAGAWMLGRTEQGEPRGGRSRSV